MINLKVKELVQKKGLTVIVIAHDNLYAGTRPQGGDKAVLIHNPHVIKGKNLIELFDVAFITAPYVMSELKNEPT